MDYSASSAPGEAYLARVQGLLKEAFARLAERVDDPALREAALKVARGESDISDFLQRPDVSSLVDRGMTQFSEQVRRLSEDQKRDMMRTAMAQAQDVGLADSDSVLPVIR